MATLCRRNGRHPTNCFVGYRLGRHHRRSYGITGVIQHRALVGVSTCSSVDGCLSRHQRNGVCHVVCGGGGPGAVCRCFSLVDSHFGRFGQAFSEAVEAIDPQPVEGIRSTGASALHEIVYGVIPQVIPLWTSFTLYRFESNIRSASVVGMVGAGGIGVVLWEIIRGFQYAETCAVMIIIILSVSVIDLVSARIRQHFV